MRLPSLLRRTPFRLTLLFLALFVAAASAHRGDAFRGCEYIIDALKTRAPFWKRETLAGGSSFWVEQRQSD